MQPPITYDACDSEAKAHPVRCVEEEYELLARHAATHYKIPNAFPRRQRVTIRAGRVFDTLFLELSDGTVREYWFDISSFYGNQ
jgi:hypothetical protein